MSDDEHGFEDAFRKIAESVSESFDRAQRGEFDGLARMIGVDPDIARRWAADAQEWIQDQRTHFEGGAPATDEPEATAEAAEEPASEPETFTALGPDPRDLPTEEQGIALAAISSGRWTLEPGTSTVTSVRDGQGPRDALGVVRDLRVRDWLGEDGAVTTAGQHALQRWLDSPR